MTSKAKSLPTNAPHANSEDALAEIAEQLLTARYRHMDAIEQQKVAHAEAQGRLDTARLLERAVWDKHRPALLQALLEREQAGAEPRLECAAGVFRLEESGERVVVANLAQLQAWTKRTTGDLIFLGATLPEADLDDHLHTEEPERDYDLCEAEELVTEFYRRTALLPGGCQLLPPSRMPILE